MIKALQSIQHIKNNPDSNYLLVGDHDFLYLYIRNLVKKTHFESLESVSFDCSEKSGVEDKILNSLTSIDLFESKKFLTIKNINKVSKKNRETFINVTGLDRFPEILKGIEKLQQLNFKNIKINAVLLKGINDNEKDFNEWSKFVKNNEIDFRYIELMQTGDGLDYFKKYHVPAKVFTDYINKNGWIFQTLGRDAGPSKNYINPSFKGKFGVIAPYSKDFCKSCNRLRITARGDLRLCLFGNTGISIRHLLQRDDQLEELKDLISKQLNFKKESHYLELGETLSLIHI